MHKKLMKNRMILGGATLMLAATTALADDNMNTHTGMRYDQSQYYRPNEFDVEGFGTASIGKYTIDHLSNQRIRQNTRLGLGAGVSYFITRNFGIGGDAYSENTTGAFIDSASGNLILRFPLGQSGFAPYVYGGGGHQFDLAKVWFLQLGGGMEFRFTPNVGLFVDARWVIPDKTKYYGVGRLGMRFGF
jgi:Outer membrane protein beta-barrel domain